MHLDGAGVALALVFVRRAVVVSAWTVGAGSGGVRLHEKSRTPMTLNAPALRLIAGDSRTHEAARRQKKGTASGLGGGGSLNAVPSVR